MATASKKTSTSSKDSTPAASTKKVATKSAAVKKPATEKKTVSKTVAAKTTAKKAAPAKTVKAKASPASQNITISPEHRYHMIATAAYYLAQRRGFVTGYEMQDWITAEAEIDAKLKS